MKNKDKKLEKSLLLSLYMSDSDSNGMRLDHLKTILSEEPMYRFNISAIDSKLDDLDETDKLDVKKGSNQVFLTDIGKKEARDLKEKHYLDEGNVQLFFENFITPKKDIDQVTYIGIIYKALCEDGILWKDQIDGRMFSDFNFRPGKFRETEFIRELSRKGVFLETMRASGPRDTQETCFVMSEKIYTPFRKFLLNNTAYLKKLAQVEWDTEVEKDHWDNLSDGDTDNTEFNLQMCNKHWVHSRRRYFALKLQDKIDREGTSRYGSLGSYYSSSNSIEYLLTTLEFFNLESVSDEIQSNKVLFFDPSINDTFLGVKTIGRILGDIYKTDNIVVKLDPEEIGRGEQHTAKLTQELLAYLEEDCEPTFSDFPTDCLIGIDHLISPDFNVVNISKTKNELGNNTFVQLLCTGWPPWGSEERQLVLRGSKNEGFEYIHNEQRRRFKRRFGDRYEDQQGEIWLDLLEKVDQLNDTFREGYSDSSINELLDITHVIKLMKKSPDFNERLRRNNHVKFDKFIIELYNMLFDHGKFHRWSNTRKSKEKNNLNPIQKNLADSWSAKLGEDLSGLVVLSKIRNLTAHGTPDDSSKTRKNREYMKKAIRAWSKSERIEQELIGEIQQSVEDCQSNIEESEEWNQQNFWFAKNLMKKLIHDLDDLRDDLINEQ